MSFLWDNVIELLRGDGIWLNDEEWKDVQAFLVLSDVATYLIYNACSNVCLCSAIVRRLQRAFTDVYSKNSPLK